MEAENVFVEIIVPRTLSQVYTIEFDFEVDGVAYYEDEDVAIGKFAKAIKHFNDEIMYPVAVKAPDIVHWENEEDRPKPEVARHNFRKAVEIKMKWGTKSVESYTLSLIDKYPPSLDAIFDVFKIFIKCFRAIRSEKT